MSLVMAQIVVICFLLPSKLKIHKEVVMIQQQMTFGLGAGLVTQVAPVPDIFKATMVHLGVIGRVQMFVEKSQLFVASIPTLKRGIALEMIQR